MKIRVVVNDTMQSEYVYFRTEPPGRNFALAFTPELTPKQMLRLGVFGGKYMTDCREEFPASWFASREAVQGQARRSPELLRRQRLAIARGVAAERLDPSSGSARMVPVVLPLLHGPAERRRRAADQTLARHPAPRVRHSEELRTGGCRVPPEAAAGGPALGL